FAERYLYLPSVGFCLLIVLIAVRATRRVPQRARKPAAITALAVVVFWFSAQTFARNPDWRDNATLFRRTLYASPNAPFVHFMVASTGSDDSGSRQVAETHYVRAIELAQKEGPPDFLDISRAYEGLASLYADRGDFARALDALHEWRQLTP